MGFYGGHFLKSWLSKQILYGYMADAYMPDNELQNMTKNHVVEETENDVSL